MTPIRSRRYAVGLSRGAGNDVTVASSEPLLVLTTCANPEEARRLAVALVEQRLAACVNAVGNVVSTYRWRNEVQQDQESLLVIKTTVARFEALSQAIRDRSSYELPEVLAVAVRTGSAEYLEWLRASVDDGSSADGPSE